MPVVIIAKKAPPCNPTGERKILLEVVLKFKLRSQVDKRAMELQVRRKPVHHVSYELPLKMMKNSRG
ncbi:hypothetical protein J6590_043699 [Homalodisca vitripennis]|nr:hypothetical protein J6590_043699 [Homalodisca vitripennis]